MGNYGGPALAQMRTYQRGLEEVVGAPWNNPSGLAPGDLADLRALEAGLKEIDLKLAATALFYDVAKDMHTQPERLETVLARMVGEPDAWKGEAATAAQVVLAHRTRDVEAKTAEALAWAKGAGDALAKARVRCEQEIAALKKLADQNRAKVGAFRNAAALFGPGGSHRQAYLDYIGQGS